MRRSGFRRGGGSQAQRCRERNSLFGRYEDLVGRVPEDPEVQASDKSGACPWRRPMQGMAGLHAPAGLAGSQRVR